MTTSPTRMSLPREQIRAYASGHRVRRAAVPIEHSLWLPLATRHLAVAGYAMFVGPALPVTGQPLELGAPARWWAARAQRHELPTYAPTVAFPFACTALTRPVTVSAGDRSIASIRGRSQGVGGVVQPRCYRLLRQRAWQGRHVRGSRGAAAGCPAAWPASAGPIR